MQKMLTASKVALETMPLDAKPAILIVTACNITCDTGTKDRFNDPSWRDISIHLLDLSPFYQSNTVVSLIISKKLQSIAGNMKQHTIIDISGSFLKVRGQLVIVEQYFGFR